MVWLEKRHLAFAVANCVFNLRFAAATAGSCVGLLVMPAIWRKMLFLVCYFFRTTPTNWDLREEAVYFPPWGLGNGGTVLIMSWKCNFSIYLDIQVYYLNIQAITTLLCLLLVLCKLFPSIHSFFYLTTALLKSDIFQHSKAYSSHSFQPTGIGLGSLWKGNRCVLPIISVYL